MNKGVSGYLLYTKYMANAFILNEDDNSVEILLFGKDFHIDYIKHHYRNDIEMFLGKKVYIK